MSAKVFGISRKCSKSGKQSQSDYSRTRKLGCEALEARRLLAVITVDTTEDVVDLNDGRTSLREAVFAANLVEGHDEIVFDFGSEDPSTIMLTEGEIEISKALTLTGPGASQLTIDASGSDPTPDENNGDGSRIFTISGGREGPIDVSIAGVTLTGGDVNGSGGAIRSFGDLDISNSAIVQNFASREGGGLDLTRNASLDNLQISFNASGGNGGGVRLNTRAEIVIAGSEIASNSAGGGGGGIWSSRSLSTTILDSIITQNEAIGFGGGLGFISGRFSIERTQVTNNRGLEGGGIYASGGSLDIHDTILNSNFASNAGGGLRTNAVQVVIEDSEINRNIVIESESQGGAIYQTRGESSLLNTFVTNNVARATSTSGGGIAIADGSLSVEGGGISFNFASLRGAGIATERATVHLNETHFMNNRGAETGTAVWASDSVLSIGQTEFRANSADQDGGALHVTATETTIVNSEFAQNEAREGSGGAIRMEYGSRGLPLNIISTIFRGNRSGNEGGAIASNALGSVDIRRSLFQFNESQGEGGGAIFSEALTQLSVVESALTDNRSTFSGGAIYSAGELSIKSSIVSRNQSDGQGGGVYAFTSRRGIGPIVVDSTSVIDNQAQGDGGGLFLQNSLSEIDIVNSTVANNRATLAGGGIYWQGVGQADDHDRIRHSTIVANHDSSQQVGGGIVVAGANLALDHSIVFNNQTDGVSYDLASLGRPVIRVNHSIIGVIVPSTVVTASELQLGVNPQLTGPSFRGDSLPIPGGDFHLPIYFLSSQSPAIDAGDPNLQPGIGETPEFDQRGAPISRVIASGELGSPAIIDIGAYELDRPRILPFHGDYDADRRVSGNDFLIWQRNAGTANGAVQQDGDATGDGDVDHNDLAVWQTTYGRFVPGAPRLDAVPTIVTPPSISAFDDALTSMVLSYRPDSRSKLTPIDFDEERGQQVEVAQLASSHSDAPTHVTPKSEVDAIESAGGTYESLVTALDLVFDEL